MSTIEYALGRQYQTCEKTEFENGIHAYLLEHAAMKLDHP